jgi:hypothetical protein
MSRENLPMRKSMQGTRVPLRNPSAGLLGVLRGVFRPGDPDGSKAAAASTRSRQTEPLSAVRRLNNYAHQDGREFPRVTPRRRRRINKKLRARGILPGAWGVRPAWMGDFADAILDEVTG